MPHKPPAPSTRLRQLAARVRACPRATVADLYRLGKVLIEAKGIVPRGGFRAWVAGAGLPANDADRAMLAAKRIRAPIELLRNVQASAARVLASKKVARSAKLTEAALAAEPGPNGLIGYRAMQSAITTVDPWAVHDTEETKEGPVEAAGRRLLALANDQAVTALFLSFDRDNLIDGIPTASVTVMREGGRTTSTRTEVDAALAEVTGEEAPVLCKPCGRHLLPASFSKGSHNCKRCERIRVGTYTKAKRKRNAETRKKIREMEG